MLLRLTVVTVLNVYQNSVYSLAFCKFQPPPAQNMVRGLELLYALGGKSFLLECGDLSSICGPVYLLNFILMILFQSRNLFVFILGMGSISYFSN